MPRSTSSFQFKQFSLQHHRSPMPVGVDSMMLGAWCNSQEARHILDIGCGCGILGFMCAQKSVHARITGIDISDSAVEEAELNRVQSPWAERLQFKHHDLKNYQPSQEPDLIISNPPFYHKGAQQSPLIDRANARQSNTLSLESLFEFSEKHLAKNGRIALVLPYELFDDVQQLVYRHKMRFHRLLLVKPTPDKKNNRMCLEIGRANRDPKSEELTLRKTCGSYSPAYKMLTQDFYR